MFLSPRQKGDHQSHTHQRETDNPELMIRGFPDKIYPLFHPIRKGEIGESLHNKDKADKAEKESHNSNDPQRREASTREFFKEISKNSS